MSEEMVRNGEQGQGQVYPQELATVAENIHKADAMFSFLGDYTFDGEVAAIRNDLTASANSMLSAGCRLLRLKEHEGHGRFMKALEELGIVNKTARRLMNTAMKFVSDTGSVKYPRLMQQSVSKIYELALLDDDDLKDLDDGKPVADIDVDEVDRMTVRDLRKKVREAKKEREALENVIKSKSEKLDELEKEIALKEQASTDGEEEKRYVPQPEDVNALRNEITLLATDSYDLYQRMVSLADRIEKASSGSDLADSSYRLLFGQLKGAAASITEEMERAMEYVESRVPESLTPVSGFDFMGTPEEVDK